ncbi:hypothetical protein [Sphingosinicella sp. BN140058]|uniref:hypothetical protein n=1 Tax=Sphingosinicella sp. BN140058 TaxID=1892855 RepID=UPI0013EAEEA7|nr:hypothetical protein [Sphingosinicella sp. BN140058]
MSAELETGRRQARRGFSASFMSNTKWRVFFSALHSIDPPIRQLVVKLIGAEKEQRTGLPLLYPPHPFASCFELGGPFPLIELEWVEVPDIALVERPSHVPAKRLPQDVDAVRVKGRGGVTAARAFNNRCGRNCARKSHAPHPGPQLR